MNLSGFGSVYLVEGTKNYKQFALKRIKCENKTELESISKENKYYKQLNSHPNLGKFEKNYIRSKNSIWF